MASSNVSKYFSNVSKNVWQSVISWLGSDIVFCVRGSTPEKGTDSMTLADRLILRLTDQEIVDHLVYSGATGYSWYIELYETPNSIVISMDDPEGKVEKVTTELTMEQVRKALRHMLDDGLPLCLENAILTDDFDADDADQVLQTLLFGEVVYG